MTTNIGYWEQVLQAPTPAYQELFDAERKYLLENISENAKVLDIGCGDGRNISTILQNTKNVFGIDNDPVAIEDARQKIPTIGKDHFILGDAAHTIFNAGEFDVVTLIGILGNLDSLKEGVFAEANRILKNEGILIVSTYAETALEERLKIYEQIKVPIKEISGNTVIFEDSVGANISEQFSKEDLEVLGEKAGFEMISCDRVGVIGYTCKFKKN